VESDPPRVATGRHRADADGSPDAPVLPVELVYVWLLFAIVALEIVVTYSRIPASELYHVSGSGLTGGSSRVLVFSNFPTALVALAVLALLQERLAGRATLGVASIAAVLCATVFWPGVVSQANLDAKPVNALAALGVLLALVLTVMLARRGGMTRWERRRSDAGRLALAVALVVLSLPWIAADLGVFLNGVPLLGDTFQTGEYRHGMAGLPPFPPAVHHGHHHGMDGLLLVLSGLLLSRLLGDVRARRLRGVLSAYLALMLCYGLANMANDFWIEQVVKRGWTSWQIPNVLEPRVSTAWGLLLLAAAALWGSSRWRSKRNTASGGSRVGGVDVPV
jgi:hypothetical protein